MSDNNKVELHYIQGIGKKTGNPYYALEVDFPTVNNGRYKKLLFFNQLELQLLGLSPEMFKPRESK